MNLSELLTHFDGVRQMGADKYMCRCPAHDDKSPSLSITQKDDRILFYCFAGCATEDVLGSVGLSFKDLYNNPWRASYEAAVSNKGKKYRKQFDSYEHELLILKIAATDLEAGKELSIEDEARAELALLRIRGAA